MGIAAGEEKIFLDFRGDKGKIRFKEADTGYWIASAEKWTHFPELGCIIPISGEYPLVPCPCSFYVGRW